MSSPDDKPPRRRQKCKPHIALAADQLIWYCEQQGWKDPFRVLVWAAARLHRRRFDNGWLNRCNRVWKEVVRAETYDAP